MGALQVRHEAASAALVRRRITDELREYDVSDGCRQLILLVATELVGNAVKHATPSGAGMLDVTWEIDETGVLVKVADSSDAVPAPRRASPDEVSGRGLALIEAVADGWGVDRGVHGKQVWAHVPVEWADSGRWSQMA